MEHLHVSDCLAVLVKFLHLPFIASGLHIVDKGERQGKEDFDFSGIDNIGDDIPHVFL